LIRTMKGWRGDSVSLGLMENRRNAARSEGGSIKHSRLPREVKVQEKINEEKNARGEFPKGGVKGLDKKTLYRQETFTGEEGKIRVSKTETQRACFQYSKLKLKGDVNRGRRRQESGFLAWGTPSCPVIGTTKKTMER